MKGLLLGATLALAAGQMAFGTITDQLTVKSGSITCTFSDAVLSPCIALGVSLAGDVNPTNGVTLVTGTINGWSVSIAGGTSNSPDTLEPTFGLDLSVFSATCLSAPGSGCSTDNLEVLFTDMNFDNPATVGPNGFRHHFSSNIGVVGGGTASAAGSAYVDDGNVNFLETTLINTITLTTTGAADQLGPVAGTVNKFYSLTLHDIFAAVGSPGVSYSSDDSITALSVPEPAAVALFGTVLAFCASRLRRRKSA